MCSLTLRSTLQPNGNNEQVYNSRIQLHEQWHACTIDWVCAHYEY